MFYIIFGWRKVSKCKKLLKKVQCRLSLLKNKRCCIVRQLRDDVALLLKHTHYQIAFNRVEDIYKDESIVKAYELLDNFCQFILLHLSYIRRHKDCPNDINEAVSSLIFASARCGDIPELRHIRKLFRERYGQHFEATALDLLPGNLVNPQIRENLSIKLVPDEIKYKLVYEIYRIVLQTGPLALEFTSEQRKQQAYKTNAASNVVHSEGKVVHFHISSEASLENTPGNVTKDIVCLDDVEEFKSPMNKGKNEKDQRVFVFKSSMATPTIENLKFVHFNDVEIARYESSWDEKEVARKSRKIRNLSRKRSRKRLDFPESNIAMNDTQCAIYYKDKYSNKKAYLSKERRKKPFFDTSCNNLKNPYDLCVNGTAPVDTEKGILSFESEKKLIFKPIGKINSKYLRAMTMPVERSEEHINDNVVLRSNSFPVQPLSPHVHPKLPDYEELAAKFMALKNENLQKFQT